MTKTITLACAKKMTQYREIGVEDHGYFELIRFLQAGQGDAEALGILLSNRRTFCPALKEAFSERIQPRMQDLAEFFGGTYQNGDRQLILLYGGKSHTFYTSEVRTLQTKAQMEAHRAALRAERLAAQPKGMIGQKSDRKKAA
jgi:hypothetical protein